MRHLMITQSEEDRYVLVPQNENEARLLKTMYEFGILSIERCELYEERLRELQHEGWALVLVVRHDPELPEVDE